nr:hypothetical protein [Micromonospora sp. A200]
MQLAQPVLTLLWSALLLAETVTPASIGAALVVLACVVLIQRTRSVRATSQDATADAMDRALPPPMPQHKASTRAADHTR